MSWPTNAAACQRRAALGAASAIIVEVEAFERAVLSSAARHFFFMKNVNSLAVADCDNSALPVCFENASKSFTEPGSVATMRSTWPLVISVSAFLALRIGSGQLRPRASSSLSKFMGSPDGWSCDRHAGALVVAYISNL